MLIGIIVVICIAAACVAAYVIRAVKKTEHQKCYDAAYKVVKEECLYNAIRSHSEWQKNRRKQMLYLKWKDGEKQGFVFDPEQPVRIGRDLQNNEICIREGEVSSRHCVLYLYQGNIFLKDLNSSNGTWIRQGLSRRRVQGVRPVYSGDKIIVGNMTIQVTIFIFDMGYM